MNEETIRGLPRLMTDLDFVGCLAKGQFTQRDEGLLPKEIFQSLFSLVWRVNRSPLQTIDERFGCHIHQYNLIRLFDNPVRKCFPYANPGDLPDLIVDALQMLKVHGGEHIDSC